MTRKRRSKINPTHYQVIQDGVTAVSKKWKHTKSVKYAEEIKLAEINDRYKCNGVEI